MKSKRTKSVVAIVFLSLLLLGLSIFGLLYLIYRIKSGWTTNDTISTIFDVFIIIVASYSSISFLTYFSHRGNDFIILNNDIYKAFCYLEKNSKISFFEKTMIIEEREKYLNKLNKIYQKKFHDVLITFDNLGDYFDLEECSVKYTNPSFSFLTMAIMESHVKKIIKGKSLDFEKLYREVKSGELLNKPKFPLIETIIPFILGFVGLFETIYQTLSISGEVQAPMTSYLVYFGLTLIYSISLGLLYSTSFKNYILMRKQKTLDKLKKIGVL